MKKILGSQHGCHAIGYNDGIINFLSKLIVDNILITLLEDLWQAEEIDLEDFQDFRGERDP